MSSCSSDEESFDSLKTTTAFEILVQVAVDVAEEENFIRSFTQHALNAQKKPRQRAQKRIHSLREHGNTWTYSDNLLLWKAYEMWENNSEEVKRWKAQKNLADCSFPYFAHKNYFFDRRTLVGVRKHFFKLKQRDFGKVAQTETAPILPNALDDDGDSEKQCKLVVRAPKNMVDNRKLFFEKNFYAADDEKSNDAYSEGRNAEEKTFLRLSQESLHRRKRNFLDISTSSTKPASSEMIYREIVQKAKMQVLSNS